MAPVAVRRAKAKTEESTDHGLHSDASDESDTSDVSDVSDTRGAGGVRETRAVTE